MTANFGFTIVFAALDVAILTWGLRVLPREHMQILASIPRRRKEDGEWQALNLTWYGALQAVSMTSAVVLALLLAGAARVPFLSMVLTVGVVLAAALPAAGLVARLVERQRGTFTVGGAVFVSTLLAPWTALLVDLVLGGDNALPAVAALAVAYPFGEGMGRLACISFGCCYGRRLADCGPRVRAWFGWRPAVIVGPTRKASYAGHCEGESLVPAPALSALILSASALSGVPLYLAGHFRAAVALSLGVAFAWRFASEFLRADYRGEGRLSAYQWMALGCLAYTLAVLPFASESARSPDIRVGLPVLASPVVTVGLAILTIVVFLYFGVSRVTTASIRLEVRRP